MSTPASRSAAPAIQRVSTLELFFDLVFVFTLTQLTRLVAHPHAVAEYLKTILIFMTLMWIYLGYSWLTSNLALDRPLQRHLLIAAMAGFFIMALSIPTVFDAGGLPYALGLLIVTAIHAGLFKTAPTSSARAILGIAGFNFTAALLVLAAAFVRPPWDWPLWIAAVAVLLTAVYLRRERDFDLSPAHFVERHGLLLIVALGESVVAVGLGASSLTLDLTLVIAVVAALFLSASVWWTYFDKDAGRAEHQLANASPAERTRMAILGFGLAHYLMIFGIVLIAAGLEVGIEHPLGPPEAIGIWNLAAGLALYLVGDAWYRRALRIGPGRLRLLVAALALATIPLGLVFGALAQLATCVLVLQPLWILERNAPAEASTQARPD